MMDESEIRGSLWSSYSLSHDNLHQSKSMLNLLLLIQQLPSSDSAAQAVDSELPPLDSALEHEFTKSKAPMYATVETSKVANYSNSNNLVPLPLNFTSSFSVPLPMPPPPAAAVNFVNEFVSLQLNSAMTGVVSSAESYSSVPLPMATPPTAAVDFDNECAYYKSKPDLALTGVVSSPLPMSPPHPHAIDFNSERAYYKSRPDISCAAANQVNQQFNVVNNTLSQHPIANTNVFQFMAKTIENYDEAKRQRRKKANLKSTRQSRKRRQDVMKNTKKEVEDLKKIASELSLACSEHKENCDTSHYWN
ncbi:hypothetical protein SO802_032508 [Lithocarpus litseifolius]|uniref:BZIP domain-containing protein n=1 Tax=Lithocarpus litseifolius TaxID=425828 RepID=A0AAW2BC46_9ROSI